MSIGTNATPSEMLDVNGAIKIGSDFNGTAGAPIGGVGTIRWNGSEFQGYTTSGWVSFIGGGSDNLGNHTATTTLNLDNNAITNINWTGSDDGAGSGLDADLLDGQTGTYYLDNTDDQNADEVVVVPNIGIGLAATDVQAALEELQVDINGITPTLEGVLTNGDVAADGQNIEIDKVRARDADGLQLTDDSGNGIFVEDGGNVGIGTSVPDYLLDVYGVGVPVPSTTDNILARFEVETTARGAGIQIEGTRNSSGNVTSFIDLMNNNNLVARLAAERGAGNEGDLLFSTNNGTTLTEQMRITDGGNVGIGVANPTYKLHVNGKIRTNAINETSDGRLKKDITSISNASELVKAINGVTYYWRTDEFPEMKLEDRLQYGVIAQEIEKVVPELVNTDSEGWKSVEYTHLVPILLEALKEQLQVVESIKEQNQQLSASLKTISSQVKRNSTFIELMISKGVLDGEEQVNGQSSAR